MPVLNIAANMQHATPVTSYYEGKAMRLAQKMQQIQNEQAQYDLDQAPAREAMDRERLDIQKQQAETALVKAQESYAEQLSEMTKEDAEKQRDAWARAHILYKGANSPEAADQILSEVLTSTGAVDSEDEIGQARQLLDMTSPDAFFRSMYATAGEASGSDRPAALQEFDELVAYAEDASNPVRQQAAKIKLGSQARAVTDAAGTLAGPDADASAVADVKATLKGGEQAGSESIKLSVKAFEKLAPIKKSIANIDDAIKAIDAGANTGAVASRLPSVQAASIELDNVRGQMGLDVLGATTFGSLSEGELEFALSTALPTGLSPPELKAWLQRKKKAQQALASELEAAATFLGTPGNTIPKYLEFLKANGALEFGESQKSELPSAADYPEGTRATDDESGVTYVVQDGKWHAI